MNYSNISLLPSLPSTLSLSPFLPLACSGWNLPLHRMKLLFGQCPHLTQLQCNNTEDASPKLLLTSNHHFIRNTTNTQTEII